MLVLTNCLADVVDEGCLKTVNSIAKRIKEKCPDATIVSYERQSELTDITVNSNKLLLTGDIIKVLRKCDSEILFLPFPAKSSATALRSFILSWISPRKVRILYSQISDISFLAGILFRLCRADFIVLSEDTRRKMERVAGKSKVKRIKAGVQTDKFVPVSADRAKELKEKYGLSPEKPVVLHVGHLNKGRNIEQLLKISDKYQVVLVTSTLTADEQDLQLKSELQNNSVKIIEDYLPDIQEIYQLADVYFFPVEQEGRCIDSPLSCLEAAACNKPVVATSFGELKEFKGNDGFFFIESFEEDKLNLLIDKAMSCIADTRRYVMEYDWDNSVKDILFPES